MSISQNFPEEGPTLNLNFAGSKTLDPRITFSRSNPTATYMDDSGLVVTAPADAPRFDHRYVNGEIESLGLLVEDSGTNNIKLSAPAPADISKASNVEGWLDRSGVNFEFSSVTSPDGTNNAVGVAYTSAYSNYHVPFYYNQQSLLTSDTTYTLSFWVDDTELVESNGYHLTTIIGTNSFSGTSGRYFRVNYNKDTDTFSSPLYSTGSSVTAENANTIFPSANISANVEKYPNNWKRISITFKVASDYDGFYDSGDTLADVRFSYAIYMGVSAYTNDNVGNSMSTWGWQLEQAEFPTSYIPTSGSTATRSPDVVTMTGDNFSDWYNPSEFSLFANFKIDAPQQSFDTFVTIDDGTSSAKITFYRGNLDSRIRLFSHNMGGIIGTSNVESGLDSINKSAYAIAPNNTSIFLNGNLEVTNTVASNPIVSGSNTIRFGCDAGNGATPNTGRFILSQLTYYPTRLTNAQLQTLTK